MSLSKADLAAELRAFGLRAGDVVLLHAAYSTLEPLEGGPQSVLDAILETIRVEGTLLVPTFTLDFCQTRLCDLAAPSPLGVVTQFAQRDARFLRVCHPIYSFAVAGRLAPAFAAVRSQTAAGMDSVFAWLHDLDARQLNLGVPWRRGGTYIHHVEEAWGVPYRFAKTFGGTLRPPDGWPVAREDWSLYVRDWDRGVIATLDKIGRNIPARQGRLGFMSYLEDVWDVVSDTIVTGRAEGLLYRIGTPEEARGA